MLSHWTLNPMKSVLWDTWEIWQKEEAKTDTEEKADVKREAEIGVMWPQASERFQELQEEKNRIFLEFWRKSDPVDTLLSGLWPPELWENTFLLFYIIKFVIICYSSPRKLIHPLKFCSKFPSSFNSSVYHAPFCLSSLEFSQFYLWASRDIGNHIFPFSWAIKLCPAQKDWAP